MKKKRICSFISYLLVKQTYKYAFQTFEQLGVNLWFSPFYLKIVSLNKQNTRKALHRILRESYYYIDVVINIGI